MSAPTTTAEDGRRRRWVAVDLDDDARERALFERWGWAGPSLWLAFVRACKRAPVEGRVRFESEVQLAAELRVAGRELADAKGEPFTLAEFFRWTGERRWTRRRRWGWPAVEHAGWDELQRRVRPRTWPVADTVSRRREGRGGAATPPPRQGGGSRRSEAEKAGHDGAAADAANAADAAKVEARPRQGGGSRRSEAEKAGHLTETATAPLGGAVAAGESNARAALPADAGGARAGEGATAAAVGAGTAPAVEPSRPATPPAELRAMREQWERDRLAELAAGAGDGNGTGPPAEPDPAEPDQPPAADGAGPPPPRRRRGGGRKPTPDPAEAARVHAELDALSPKLAELLAAAGAGGQPGSAEP
jgi:hypothetical protein